MEITITQFKQLSTVELAQLRRDLYSRAEKDGTLMKIAEVAREFGKDPAGDGFVSTYGQKYLWKETVFGYPLEIYVDDYGNYMTVTLNNKRVCSTHLCDRLFVPNKWVDFVLEKYGEVQRLRAERKAETDNAIRMKLLDEMAMLVLAADLP